MTWLFGLAAVLAMTAVPVTVYVIADRRAATRQHPSPSGPAHGPVFWAVQRHLEHGTRAPQRRIRGLVRSEVEWRRSAGSPAGTNVPAAFWGLMWGGYVVLGVLAAPVATPIALGATYLGARPVIARVRHRRRAAVDRQLDSALAANAD